MDKVSFLKELELKLMVLNKNERSDILNEYSDVIDQKVKDGKLEREAVEDFGDFDELIREIYDAYHISTDYSEPVIEEVEVENKNKRQNGFTRFIKSVSRGSFRILKSIKNAYMNLNKRWSKHIENKKQLKLIELEAIKLQIQYNNQYGKEHLQKSTHQVVGKLSDLKKINRSLKIEKKYLKQQNKVIHLKEKNRFNSVVVKQAPTKGFIYRILLFNIKLFTSMTLIFTYLFIWFFYVLYKIFIVSIIFAIFTIALVINLSLLLVVAGFVLFAYMYGIVYIIPAVTVFGLFLISFGSFSLIIKLIKTNIDKLNHHRKSLKRWLKWFLTTKILKKGGIANESTN